MEILLSLAFLFLGVVLYLWEHKEYGRRFPSYVPGFMLALGLYGTFAFSEHPFELIAWLFVAMTLLLIAYAWVQMRLRS